MYRLYKANGPTSFNLPYLLTHTIKIYKLAQQNMNLYLFVWKS
jgi:hypothetical protein